MFRIARPYLFDLVFPSLLFLVCGVWAISYGQPLYLSIPFAWVLLPPVTDLLVYRPGKLFWLLLVCLPLSTELNITSQLGLDFPDEPLLMLLTGIVILRWIHQPKWVPYDLVQHPLFLVLVIYVFWLLVTVLYSTEMILSTKYLLAKTWYILPFVVLPQLLLVQKKDLRTLATCLLIPMAVVVLQTLGRHALYGFSFASVQKTLAPFFRNHVNYSAMLVCLLPVGWSVWKLTPASDRRRKWVLYGLLLGLAGLFFAYSRGAWMALLAGLAVVPVIRKKRMIVVVAIAVTAVLASTAWLISDNRYLQFSPDHDRTIFHTDFSDHMRATVELKDVSAAERFYRWIAGFKMLAERPVTGFGPNSFYLHYRPYTVNSFQTWVSDNPEHSTVHNYFLLLALEQGLIGLILFSVLYFGMLFHLQNLYHRLQDPFYRTIALTVAVILVMIGVINSLSDMIETDKIGSLFWLCLGMVIWLQMKNREEREVLASRGYRMLNDEQGMLNDEVGGAEEQVSKEQTNWKAHVLGCLPPRYSALSAALR